jgi:serine/threonine-protein kinase PpkA
MRIPGYKAERLVARGGMSSVYLAMQESLSRRVALKVLRRFDNPRQAERFLHEARIIASLQHRNIITIHDVGTMGERHYIAMEYLEGGSLADRIDHGIPPMQALDLLESMASCLDFVHRKDIVHRDIKPSNILFHADGTPKLTDFGIAKQIDGDQELTMEGSAFGSPYYLSPEQAEDRLLDGRSDIYGLGIVFYQMLTGRRPYEESSHIETIVAHLSNPIPVLPEELSGYQGLLEKMIAKSPDNRVGSAGELVALIQQVRSSQSGPSANTAASRGEGARKGLLARASGASFLVRLSAVAALLVLIVGSLRLIGDSPSGQAAAPRLVSRVPSIELSYEAAKARVEPQAVVNESKTVTVGATSLPETNRLPGGPEKPSIAEPVSEVADAPVAEPVETIQLVAEVVTDQQDEQDAVSAPATADD